LSDRGQFLSMFLLLYNRDVGARTKERSKGVFRKIAQKVNGISYAYVTEFLENKYRF